MLGLIAFVLALTTIYLGIQDFDAIWIIWMGLAYTPIYIGMRITQFTMLSQRGAGAVIGMFIWTIIAEFITAAILFYIGVGVGKLF